MTIAKEFLVAVEQKARPIVARRVALPLKKKKKKKRNEIKLTEETADDNKKELHKQRHQQTVGSFM